MFKESLEVEIPLARLLEFENVTVPSQRLIGLGKSEDGADKRPWWLAPELSFLTRSFRSLPEEPSGIWAITWESGNLYHWVSESLPRILWARILKISAPILIPPWLASKSFVRETLDLLELDYIVLSTRRPTRIARLYFPDLRAPIGNPRVTDTQLVSQALIRALSARGYRPKDTPRRLWLSRHTATRRREANWLAVQRVLEQNGIEVIDPETRSFSEILGMAHGAAWIGGLHGAALTHAYVMNPDSVFVEVRRPGQYSNCYMTMAQSLDLRYQYLVGKPTSRRRHANLEVDLAALRKLLSSP